MTTGEVPGSRRVLLGCIDVGGSSAASFLVGIFATHFLAGETLGVYALLFMGFLVSAVVPAQLLCVPAEIEAVHEDTDRQFHGLLRLAPWVLGAGIVAAASTTLIVMLSVGIHRPGLGWLAATMIPVGGLSPLQDHVRRLCHQADASAVAAAMSAVQGAGTLGGLVAIGWSSGSRAAAPFGALVAANALSLALGFALLRRRSLAFTGRTAGIRRLVATGRWLIWPQGSQLLAGLLTLIVVSKAAGVVEAGICEAVRVLSQPIFVMSTGLLAVMNPAIFRSRLSGNVDTEARVHRHYRSILIATSLLLLLVLSTVNPWNPLRPYFPAAFERRGLLEAMVLAQLLFFLPQSRVSTLLAQRKVREATVAQVAGLPLQVMFSAAAFAVGAWAYALSFFGAAVGRLFVFGTLERHGRLPFGLFELDPQGPRLRMGQRMTANRLIEEPSLIGAVRRHRLVFLGCLLVGLLAGGSLAGRGSAGFEATVALTLEDPRISSVFTPSSNLNAERYVADQVAVMTSQDVMTEAASAISRGAAIPTDPAVVRQSLIVRSGPTSNVVTVAYAGATESDAAAGAAAVADSYEAVAEADTAAAVAAAKAALDAQMDTLDLQIAALDTTIATLDSAARATAGSGVRDARIDAALTERSTLVADRNQLAERSRQLAIDAARNPSGITHRGAVVSTQAPTGFTRFLLLGAIVGSVLGVAVAYVLARRRRAFESVDEPQRLFGVRYLASLPAETSASRSPAAARERESALDFLATVIEIESRRDQIGRLGFVSPSASLELAALGRELQGALAGGRQTVDREVARHRSVGAVADTPEKVAAGQFEPNGHPIQKVNGNGSHRGHLGRRSVLGEEGKAGDGAGTAGRAGSNGTEHGRAESAPLLTDNTIRPMETSASHRSPSHGASAQGAVRSAPVATVTEVDHRTNQAPGGTSAVKGESLVLVELPDFLDGSDGAGQLDAIVLVLMANEQIEATAEVVRRVTVLGWKLLGYVYVTAARKP